MKIYKACAPDGFTGIPIRLASRVLSRRGEELQAMIRSCTSCPARAGRFNLFVANGLDRVQRRCSASRQPAGDEADCSKNGGDQEEDDRV